MKFKMNSYQKSYLEFLNKFLFPNKMVKVVFDCSNGTTGGLLKNLKREKLSTIFINEKPEGDFPAHGPNPLKSGALRDAQLTVKKQKADLGIVFDADGDRAIFIDDKGRMADPDAIGYLLIWNLKTKKIVVDETTSMLIRGKIDKASGAEFYETIKSENGGYAIKNAMSKNKADFACERSGHYYFARRASNKGKLFYFDSGILAAIEVINAVSKLPYKLSDFLDLLPNYYRSGDINIKSQKLKSESQKLFKRIENKYKKNAGEISYVDGLRMDFYGGNRKKRGGKGDFTTRNGIGKESVGNKSGEGRWWFNIQPSNTEPLLRLNIEAENKQTLEKERKKLIMLVTAN